MNSVLKPLAISLAVAWLFPATSFAQTSSDSSATTQTVIVTASRQPEFAKDVLADNLVITSDEIAKSGAATVVDLLQQQRGIEIARNGGPGSSSSIFVRGTTNAQNVVLVDGVRIGSATSGGATWSSIPLAQIDRIEVVYGPLSALYGADAMGGVIQIFTKKGAKTFVPTVSIGAGSDGQRVARAGVSGSLAESLTYALNVGHEEATGFSATKRGAFGYDADKDGYVADNVSGNASWKYVKGHELGVQFLQSRINSQIDSDPGFDDRNVSRLETFGVSSKNRFTADWTSELIVSSSEDKGVGDALYFAPPNYDKYRGKSEFTTKQQVQSWQNSIRFDKDVLQLIAEHRDEAVVIDTFQDGSSRSASPVHVGRLTNSLATSYVLKRDTHLASASLRADRSTQYGNRSTGSVAYGYRLTEAWRVNASYGTSFRAPNFNELYYPNYGNKDIKPEIGKNKEIGTYFEDDSTQASAVYFQNKITDLIGYSNVCFCAYNVNQATLSGLSLSAKKQWDGLTLRGAMDFQNPKDDTTGKILVRRAKRHASVGGEYVATTMGVKTAYGVETLFSSERFDDVANTQKRRLAGYGLLNLYVSADVAKNMTLLARWNNVFNKEYEQAKNYATQGSRVFVGLNYAFK
jgi:vitamin B12 transporter